MKKSKNIELFDPKNKNNGCVALIKFENDTIDTGGKYKVRGSNITFCDGRFGRAVRSVSSKSQVVISGLPFNKRSEIVTVSTWIRWNGINNVKPFGWHAYSIWFVGGAMGFNTGNGDLYGIPSSDFKNTWRHIVVEFIRGKYGRIWVDGELQKLSQKRSKILVNGAVIKRDFHIFGWGKNSGYRHFGCVDQLRIFNRELTNEEIEILYNEGM